MHDKEAKSNFLKIVLDVAVNYIRMIFFLASNVCKKNRANFGFFFTQSRFFSRDTTRIALFLPTDWIKKRDAGRTCLLVPPPAPIKDS